MCKSAATTTSEDKKENVESNNYGLLNLSSSSMATMDLGEILLVVLLIVVGLGVLCESISGIPPSRGVCNLPTEESAAS